MLTKSLLFSAILLVLITSCSSSRNSGNAGKWQKLGEKVVNHRIERDVVNVNAGDGAFRQLRFVVRKGSLNMYKCIVYFENGGLQDVGLRYTFTPGSNSRIIDLQGTVRHIDRISFWYNTRNNSGNKAVLVVWGK